jgi:hypothetical protein
MKCFIYCENCQNNVEELMEGPFANYTYSLIFLTKKMQKYCPFCNFTSYLVLRIQDEKNVDK